MSTPPDEVGSIWSRWKRGFRRIRQSADWSDFVGPDWADRIMTEEITQPLFQKQGRTIGKWLLRSADGRTMSVYLKRHFVLPRKHGLLAVLFPHKARSPGLEEWEHLEWAREHGLPVARPVAAGEIVGPGGRLQSFVAIEELKDQYALHEAIPMAKNCLGDCDFRRWKRTLTDELVRLSEGFHGQNAFHKDWYLCHFYIDVADTRCVPEQWEGRVTVIDLHRMSLHPLTRPYWRSKDLGQLLYSTDPVEGVTDRDRLAFWAKYRRRIRLPWLVRKLARIKWRLYQRHDAPKG